MLLHIAKLLYRPTICSSQALGYQLLSSILLQVQQVCHQNLYKLTLSLLKLQFFFIQLASQVYDHLISQYPD